MATKQAPKKTEHAMTAADKKARAELDAITLEVATHVLTSNDDGVHPRHSLQLVRATIVRVARALVGVREIGKTNSGYWIDKFLGHLGLKPGYAWCMAVVQFILLFVSRLLGLKDLLPFNHAGTKAVYDWAVKKGYTTTTLAEVEPGDLIFWQNGKGPQGHVGIVVKRNGTLVETVEGNTSDGNWRDGGGMSEKRYVIDPEKIGVAQRDGRWLRGFVRLEKLFDASRQSSSSAVTAA